MSAVREHLQAIYDQHGRLTPEIVVDAVRSKSHPLHAHVFDRAPKEAAAAWYRSRAHDLIKSVRVSYGPEDSPRIVRAFHAVRISDQDSGFTYEPVEKVASDEFLRSLVLRDMEREWKQLLKRYEDFEEFLSMVREDIAA